MGFLDNIFDAIESGKLEERLEGFADKMEGVSKKVIQTTEEVADTPQRILDKATAQKDQIEHKIKVVKSAGKSAKSEFIQ